MGGVELELASFRGRHAFVTGHTGFKGSWLTTWLTQLGARVTGLSLAPETQPNNFHASGVRDCLVEHYEADVRDPHAVRQALRHARPDFVFHLAAQPLVRRSYARPHHTIDVNVSGTSNLLDAIREMGHPCVVVVVTSDKCYADPSVLGGCRESNALGGEDPYSASKAAAEIVTSSYRTSYFAPEAFGEHGVQLASVRAGNVIGGGDWSEDRIVTDIVRALQANQPIVLRNPRAVRPWQHVLDALSGYLLLADRMYATLDPTLSSAWNFGPHNELHSVRAVAEAFVSSWGSGSWESVGDPVAWSETPTLTLNTQKAQAELGWRPVWEFSQAIDRTSQWYQRFADNPKAASGQQLCLRDIQDWHLDQQRCADPVTPAAVTSLNVSTR